jgi:polysaccharide export outer membrane protein
MFLNHHASHENSIASMLAAFLARATAVTLLATGLSFLISAADLSTAKPSPAAAPPSDYRLGPEDVIDVFVWKEPDLSKTVTVRPDGKISLPLSNELDANGKTALELQKEIAERLKQYIQQPVVNVMVKQINSQKISVLGEVRKPDVYRIQTRVTVLDAIAMAGGFTDLARPNKVVILRNSPQGQQRIPVNLKQAIASDKIAPVYLQSQDTVYVEGH